MDTTLKNKAEALLGEPLLDEPVRPESWECCGSDCGDVCIQTGLLDGKSPLRCATAEIERSGLDGDEDNGKVV